MVDLVGPTAADRTARVPAQLVGADDRPTTAIDPLGLRIPLGPRLPLAQAGRTALSAATHASSIAEKLVVGTSTVTQTETRTGLTSCASSTHSPR